MTIEKAIKEIDRQILCLTDYGNVTKEVLALEKLVDITHKYQKIKQIYSDWNNGHFSDAVFCLRVKAVIEDGNDD